MINQSTFAYKYTSILWIVCALLIPVIASAQAKPNLIWLTDADSLDFGPRVAGRPYRVDITLKNTGNESRSFDEWQAACPCLQVIGMPQQIPAGQTAVMAISLKTEKGDRGYYGSSVYFLTDDPVRPILRIPVKVVWTDESGSVSPPAMQTQGDTGGNQEYAAPPMAPLTPIPPEEQQEQYRERSAKDLMSDSSIDSLLQTLPDSLRDAFRTALEKYARQSFTPSSPAPQIPPSGTFDPNNPEAMGYPSDSLFERPGELTPRAFDSITAVLRGEQWIPPETMETANLLLHPFVLEFYHSASCRICAKATKLIEPIVLSFGGRVLLKHYYTDTDSGLGHYIATQQQRRVRGNPFLLTVGNENFTDLQSLDSLQPTIKTALTKRIVAVDTISQEALQQIIRTKFRNLQFWTLLGAGVLDLVNPCALATLVFFFTLLTFISGRRRTLLSAGLCYLVIVYITHFLITIGAFNLIVQLSLYRTFIELFFVLSGLFLLFLVFVSLRDLWFYMNGASAGNTVLHLYGITKRKMPPVIPESSSNSRYIVAALVLGFLSTLFETPCSGRIYAQTIALSLNDPEWAGLAWLDTVLYSLSFILPLLLVFFLLYKSVAKETYSDWSKRNYGWIKFALLILFVVLSVKLIKELML